MTFLISANLHLLRLIFKKSKFVRHQSFFLQNCEMRYFKENRRKSFLILYKNGSIKARAGSLVSSLFNQTGCWVFLQSSLKRELKYSFAQPTTTQHIADLAPAPGPGSKHTKTPPIHKLLTSIITTLENNIRKFPT